MSTTRKQDATAALLSALDLAQDIPDRTGVRLLNEVLESADAFEVRRMNLLSATADMTARMQRLARTVLAAQHVNSLGEVQGAGSQLDIACALYQEGATRTLRAVYLLKAWLDETGITLVGFDDDRDGLVEALLGADGSSWSIGVSA